MLITYRPNVSPVYQNIYSFTQPRVLESDLSVPCQWVMSCPVLSSPGQEGQGDEVNVVKRIMMFCDRSRCCCETSPVAVWLHQWQTLQGQTLHPSPWGQDQGRLSRQAVCIAILWHLLAVVKLLCRKLSQNGCCYAHLTYTSSLRTTPLTKIDWLTHLLAKTNFKGT